MVTFDNVLINLVRANIIQNIQEKYTGDTFRQAKNKGTEGTTTARSRIFLQKNCEGSTFMLREVSKYIHRMSKMRRSSSTTSDHDEIVLEYTVNLLRSEVKDLRIKRQS
jgi:hypothetical protein